MSNNETQLRDDLTLLREHHAHDVRNFPTDPHVQAMGHVLDLAEAVGRVLGGPVSASRACRLRA